MKGINIDSIIRQVFKSWTRNKKHVLDEFGLTISQYDILSGIYNLTSYKKSIIQMNLSEETGIDPMTVSTILRNLEKSRLIVRIRGTVDSRVVYIGLTEAGKSVYELAYSKMLQCCNELYNDIDEKELISQLLLISNELDKLNKLNN